MAKSTPLTVTVLSVSDVTPHMRRIVFGGPALADFPEGREGGYIKLIFPDAPRANPDRPVLRTYSVRAQDKEEITVDIAIHADTNGVAMDWAMQAKVGDTITITGPGRVKMAPPDADWYLIAADMTGLPAALCNIERLSADAKGYAVFEVASEADIQDITAPSNVKVAWVVDPKPQQLNNTLLGAIKALPWLEGEPFIWSACEFDTMRALRSYYRTDRAVDKKAIYLSSYWRAGRTEDQHKVEKRKDSVSQDPAA